MCLPKKRRAFTLVELLVVIAIIALLLSILVPALAKAREQARLMIDAANSKQVGTYTALYQNDNDGFVPVIFNQYLASSQPAQYYWPKYHLISVAFASYAPETANPSSTNAFISLLAPSPPWTDQPWYNSASAVQKYYTYLMPKQYCCPFTRGNKTSTTTTYGRVILGGTSVSTITTAGYRDTFGMWIRACQNFAGLVWWPNHPLGPPNGIEKYGVLPWNRTQETRDSKYWNLSFDWAIKNPIKWGKNNLQEVKAGSLADATALYCNQGQSDDYAQLGTPYGLYNYGSHKRGGIGGTNAIFGDLHVDWVNGFQIGWP